MSLLCQLMLAVGFGLSVCETPPVETGVLPKEDSQAWAVRPKPVPEPEPAPAPPAPPAPVTFPPVVVEKVIEKKIYVSAPERSAPPPPAPRPDHTREAMEASYDLRAAGTWPAALNIPAPGPAAPVSPSSLGTPGPLSAPTPALRPGAGGKEGSGYRQPARTSTGPVDNTRKVTTDRYISGIVESGVNSQLAGDDADGGEVVIQVSRDVFGYHGRLILIPKGSRLVCGYKAPKAGETRLGIKCKRVLLGESRAEIWQAAAGAYDGQGRPGVAGTVDHRFWEQYGSALVLAGISGAVRAAGASIPKDAGGADIAGEGTQEVSERFGEITASVLEKTVNLGPVVTLSQGARVVLRPGRDWILRESRGVASPGRGKPRVRASSEAR